MLFDLNKQYGTTLVLVTHDLSLAKRCQRSVEMKDGHLINQSAVQKQLSTQEKKFDKPTTKSAKSAKV